MFPLTLVCLKFYISIAFLLVIPKILCLSMWSPYYGLVGLKGGKTLNRVFNLIYVLFLEHLNAFVELMYLLVI